MSTPYRPEYLAGAFCASYDYSEVELKELVDARLQDAGHVVLLGRRRPQIGAGGLAAPDLLDTVAQIGDGTYRHLLLPVFLVTTRNGDDVQQVIISGVDGRISARPPLSWWKLGTVAGAAAALTALYPRIADWLG
jgi:hypothetical protein